MARSTSTVCEIGTSPRLSFTRQVTVAVGAASGGSDHIVAFRTLLSNAPVFAIQLKASVSARPSGTSALS